jgi:hypothetical protein
MTSEFCLRCPMDSRCILQGNGPVSQVETSPEILSYRAYLVMTAHKMLAADTRYKGAKKITLCWDVQLKFAPTRTRVTAASLAVALYSPVNS